MSDRNAQFEPARPLAMTRGALLNGHSLARLAPVAVVAEPTDRPGEITADVAERLWASGALEYADLLLATPVEDPRAGVTSLVEIEDLGGSWFLLRAPWSAEGVKVQGVEAAAKARDELIEEGLASLDLSRSVSSQLFLISEGSGGWYQITGPGLTEPLRVRGEAAALSKRDELERAAASPAPPPPPLVEPPLEPPVGDGEDDGNNGGGSGDETEETDETKD